MLNRFLWILVVIPGLSVVDDVDPGLLLSFWNVENLFEPYDDGARHWTRGRYRAKCDGIAKTLFLMADSYGRMPDIAAFAEVGNAEVMKDLVFNTGLRRFDYDIVHYDSPDRRGIDCALLYRRSRFRLIRSKPCHLYDSLGRILPTRDILLVILAPAQSEGFPPEGRNTRGSIAGGPSRRDGGVSPKGDLPKGEDLQTAPIAVLVNHHPSKVGQDSEGRRKTAMGRLLFLRDSLRAEGISRIVAVGDFNDEVQSASGITAEYAKGAGTIKFQGKWEKIDGCPVLEGFTAREYIFAPPHLTTRDATWSGLKPHRTFSGPRYLAGLSDHYPIILELSYNHE